MLPASRGDESPLVLFETYEEPQLDVRFNMRGRPWTGPTRAQIVGGRMWSRPERERMGIEFSKINLRSGDPQSIVASDTSVLRGFANVQGEWE